MAAPRHGHREGHARPRTWRRGPRVLRPRADGDASIVDVQSHADRHDLRRGHRLLRCDRSDVAATTSSRSASTPTPVSATPSPPAPDSPRAEHLPRLRHGAARRGRAGGARRDTATPRSAPAATPSGSPRLSCFKGASSSVLADRPGHAEFGGRGRGQRFRHCLLVGPVGRRLADHVVHRHAVRRQHAQSATTVTRHPPAASATRQRPDERTRATPSPSPRPTPSAPRPHPRRPTRSPRARGPQGQLGPLITSPMVAVHSVLLERRQGSCSGTAGRLRADAALRPGGGHLHRDRRARQHLLRAATRSCRTAGCWSSAASGSRPPGCSASSTPTSSTRRRTPGRRSRTCTMPRWYPDLTELAGRPVRRDQRQLHGRVHLGRHARAVRPDDQHLDAADRHQHLAGTRAGVPLLLPARRTGRSSRSARPRTSPTGWTRTRRRWTPVGSQRRGQRLVGDVPARARSSTAAARRASARRTPAQANAAIIDLTARDPGLAARSRR